MYKSAMKKNAELSEKTGETYFTDYKYCVDCRYRPFSSLEEYSYCIDNDFRPISPEKVAWFFMLLYKEKVMHFLSSDQLNKLDGLLSADRKTLTINCTMQTPEECAYELLWLRELYVDPECTEFNWEYAVYRYHTQSVIEKVFAYHMDCPQETASTETEKVLGKLIDPELRDLYPDWEVYIDGNTKCMFKELELTKLEDWLSFQHPFFNAHSKNPLESAKNYYELFADDSWLYSNYKAYGYINEIKYSAGEGYLSGFKGTENSQMLSAWRYEYDYYTNTGIDEELDIRFISEYSDELPVYIGDCGIPCDGWYDKDKHRYLINPLGMTGLFEFRYTYEDTDEYGAMRPLYLDWFEEPYKSYLIMQKEN